MTSLNQKPRILIIRMDRFGDLLMNIPMIHRIRQNFPKAHISVMCQPVNKPLLQWNFDVNSILAVEPSHIAHFFGKFKLWFTLLGKGYDCVIVTHPHKFFHALSFLLGAKLRIGFNRKWGFFLNHKLKDNKADGVRHEIDSNLDLLDEHFPKKWNGKIDLGFETHPDIKMITESFDLTPGKKRIAFHLTSSTPKKSWPLENFKEVIQELIKQPRYQIILIGKEWTDEMEQIFKFDDNVHFRNFIGKTNFPELAILLQKVQCVVSLDSGPFHLAWMQRTPTVGLFVKESTGSNPKRWGVYKDFAPSIEFHKESYNIAPNEVLEAIRELV